MDDVLIIGGGQAGLVMGYLLQQQGYRFTIMETGAASGEAWRNRWESLRLFTPAAYSALPGLPFPLAPELRPTKDQVAAYLELYCEHFELPVHFNQQVVALMCHDDHFVAQTAQGAEFRARQVVIATGAFQTPTIPAFADNLVPEVFQLHTAHYRNPAQLPEGAVLVVGAGNSGAEIAADLCRTRKVYLSQGRWLPHVPGWMVKRWGFWLSEKSGYMDVTIDSWLGRLLSQRDAVYGVNFRELKRRYGLEVLPRAVRAEGQTVMFKNGLTLEVNNVVWATGFRPHFPWVKLPVFDEQGRPCHQRGVTAIPGLHFLGLSWQWTRGSALIGWVHRDAAYLLQKIQQFSR